MNVKIGDLTVSQVKGICNRNFPCCEKCQLGMYGNKCFVVASCSTSAFSGALDYELETEIDLSDEEKEPEHYFPRFIDTGFGGE